MSKNRRTGFQTDLWRVDYIDRFTWDDSYQGEVLSKALAERKYNELTSNGTKNTEHDKNCLGYYRLVQARS